jgi:hypothetical protein
MGKKYFYRREIKFLAQYYYYLINIFLGDLLMKMTDNSFKYLVKKQEVSSSIWFFSYRFTVLFSILFSSDLIHISIILYYR